MHTDAHAHTCTHTLTLMHTHAHAHTHMHTRTCTRTGSKDDPNSRRFKDTGVSDVSRAQGRFTPGCSGMTCRSPNLSSSNRMNTMPRPS